MNAPPVLTPHQCEAVSWLVERLCENPDAPTLVALRGYAGSGKTTLIPALRQTLQDCGMPVVVGSPTHRAAMVLKRKGIRDADTIHHHALTPYFTTNYRDALEWLGETCPVKDDADAPTAAVDGVPWLIHEAIGADADARRLVLAHARAFTPHKALESIGISGRNHFTGFGPKLGQGCLVIDEASMVGADQLTLCQQAFRKICLIGDPGQLPPVRDTSSLLSVPGFDLTEVHRQAAESPILQLAYAAREGKPFWQSIPTVTGALEVHTSYVPRAFLDAPLLVWRNATRVECTRAIREQLGYSPERVAVGEPLVCRSTNKQDRALGMYNNSLWRVVEVSSTDPRRVTVVQDDDDQEHDILLHMEELDGSRIDPRAIPFRFGYCLTVHTAQGGEWPLVAISLPDLMAYAGFCFRPSGIKEDLQRWAYTAITRAKQTLCFLSTHDFTSAVQVRVPVTLTEAPMPTPTGPRTSPMFTVPSEDTTVAPADPLTPGLPEPDDIPDPVVPPATVLVPEPMSSNGTAERFGEHEALLSGFVQTLQKRLMSDIFDQSKSLLRCIDAVYERTTSAVGKLAEANEHSQYQLGAALAQLQEKGVQVTGHPYQVSVQCVTGQGLPCTITVQRDTADELISSLQGLSNWLTANGYTAPEAKWY